MSRQHVADPAKIEQRLRQGLDELGLGDNASLFDGLTHYLELLQRWNKVYNLTAIRDPLEMVTLHLLDSLVLLPHVSNGRLLDVGSGAGLPGIPLALARPDLEVVMIDASAKKARFINQTIFELGLRNARAVHGRVEALEEPPFEQIISRAFSSLDDFFTMTSGLLAPGGRWLAMKGLLPQEELGAIGQGVKIESIEPLKVPGLEAERHLLIAEVAKD